MSKNKAIYGGLVGVALLLLCVAVWLNRGYGEVGEQGYDLALSLVSACSRQDSIRVDELSQLVDSSVADGKLSSSEARWLEAILSAAKSKRWEAAAQQARKLLNAQVTPSPSLPVIEQPASR